MLVLSRKVGEKIVIPGLDAEIAVVAIKGKAVRLAIIAPAEVSVRRQELTGQRHAVASGALPDNSHG
jgi:carbon storage regulator CsrA